MESGIFKYIWKHSLPQQAFVLFVTVLSFPILFLTLELPKQIINDAIEGDNFPREIVNFEFSQVEYLFLLCFLFLGTVIVHNAFKFFINVYKGLVGERMLRRLRYDLYFRLIRFRLPQFRKMSSGEIIPMITAEVEALGGFIGEAFATPAFQAGNLIVYFFFIALQSPVLGVAAISLYPLQMWLIPKMQARVVRMTRKRIKNIRRLSDRVGESISGVSEIHANDTSAWHLSEVSARLYENFKIRFEIFIWKYLIKFTNNIINQLTPFFFYAFGGYLVIQGEMVIGSLVAALVAYKDLAAPWKELLAYYQEAADVQVKYKTVVENFDPPDLYAVNRFTSDPPADTVIDGNIRLENVSLGDAGSGQDLQGVSFEVASGSGVALVGGDSSGRTEALQVMAGLLSPQTGRAYLGEASIEDLPESVLGRKLAYLSSNLHIFTGTIRSNLLYGLRHKPLPREKPDPEWEKALKEAKQTANSLYDFDAEWDDPSQSGVETQEELDVKAVLYLYKVGFGPDLYRMGMQANIDPGEQPELATQILQARWTVAERVAADPTLQNAIVLWNPDTLNHSATLAENVLFALPSDGTMDMEALSTDKLVLAFLERTGLKDDLVEIGLAIAETMVDLFANVSSDNALLSEYSFIRPEEIPIYERRIAEVKSSGVGTLSASAVSELISVAFQLIPARHRLGVLTDAHIGKIVASRQIFKEMLAEKEDTSFVPFERDAYIAAQSIGDNLIFGKVRLDRRDARAKIDQLVGDIVAEQNLRAPISLAGLSYDVGIAGSRLSAGQRQKVGIVRALMKQPAVLILDDVATYGGDDDKVILDFLTREFEDMTLVYGAPRLNLVSEFEHIIYMQEGRVLTTGPYHKVAETSGVE
ncbi:MAG: ABC transporter transmembrane domain-containing protein [Pseudomonadota bacterium]